MFFVVFLVKIYYIIKIKKKKQFYEEINFFLNNIFYIKLDI